MAIDEFVDHRIRFNEHVIVYWDGTERTNENPGYQARIAVYTTDQHGLEGGCSAKSKPFGKITSQFAQLFWDTWKDHKIGNVMRTVLASAVPYRATPIGEPIPDMVPFSPLDWVKLNEVGLEIGLDFSIEN
jgi:hypothetical protein